jgi:hypothetical protein
MAGIEAAALALAAIEAGEKIYHALSTNENRRRGRKLLDLTFELIELHEQSMPKTELEKLVERYRK